MNMTQYKGLPVSGYADQSGDNVSKVNLNKELEEIVLQRLDELFHEGKHDIRWLSIAKTEIQNGFMAMNRAIFQPKRIDLGPVGADTLKTLRKALAES